MGRGDEDDIHYFVNGHAVTVGTGKKRAGPAFHRHFGSKLLTKSGDVAAEEALKNKRVLGIYFSEKPLGAFTTTLAAIYQKIRLEHGDAAFEIIFVSSDIDEPTFRAYYEDMPWAAVPYQGAASKMLREQYMVGKGPSLELLDAGGRRLVENGLRAVRCSPYASAYPWTEEAIAERTAARAQQAKDFNLLFGGGELKQKGGEAITRAAGFCGRRVLVVRCVTRGQHRDYMDKVLIPCSSELNEKVAFVYLCADADDRAGWADCVAALPDGWFYAEPGSVAATAALSFYSEGRALGFACCEVDGSLLQEDAMFYAEQYGAAGFPWTPEAIEAAEPARLAKVAQKRAALLPQMKNFELLGGELACSSGTVNANNALLDQSHVLLYFSAHWCGPCRALTPRLAERYLEWKASGAKVEVVFVSWDKSDNDFKDYFSHMPWLALPYSNRTVKGDLDVVCSVTSIPTLVICSIHGNFRALPYSGGDLMIELENALPIVSASLLPTCSLPGSVDV